jgi:hypothetical protein
VGPQLREKRWLGMVKNPANAREEGVLGKVCDAAVKPQGRPSFVFISLASRSTFFILHIMSRIESFSGFH